MSGIITNFTVIGDGNLRIDINWPASMQNGWDREEIELELREHGAWELLEDTLCNSDFELVQPEQVPGALTSAPIIVQGAIFADLPNDYGDTDYQVVVDSLGLWWFPNYQIEDPWETLVREGKVVFDLAEQGEYEPNEHTCPDCRRVTLLPMAWNTNWSHEGSYNYAYVASDPDAAPRLVYAISTDDAFNALNLAEYTAEPYTYHAVLDRGGTVLSHGVCKDWKTVWQRVAAAAAK